MIKQDKRVLAKSLNQSGKTARLALESTSLPLRSERFWKGGYGTAKSNHSFAGGADVGSPLAICSVEGEPMNRTIGRRRLLALAPAVGMALQAGAAMDTPALLGGKK